MGRKQEKKNFSKKHSIVIKKGNSYYRTSLPDADGKRVDIYGKSEEELDQKVIIAKKKIEQARRRRLHPTVEEYSLKWLKMHKKVVFSMFLNNGI